MWYHSLVNDVKASLPDSAPRARWTFLTNHAHVLIALTREPSARVRDIAELVGITERAVLQILSDLEGAGVLEREREGRRNIYRVNAEVQLRHPLEAGHRVQELLSLAR